MFLLIRLETRLKDRFLLCCTFMLCLPQDLWPASDIRSLAVAREKRKITGTDISRFNLEDPSTLTMS